MYCFSDSKSELQVLMSKWDHPTVQTIMRFLVFLHAIHKLLFVIGCSHMGISGNEHAHSAVKAALHISPLGLAFLTTMLKQFLTPT